MIRYICVYYIATNEDYIDKTTKRVNVLICETTSKVMEELASDYGATYLKSIRDLEKDTYNIYNKEVYKIEQLNND